MLWSIVSKDLKRALRDRKSLITILVMPIILMTILGFSIGKFMDSGSGWLEKTTIGIVDLDQGQDTAQELMRFFSELSGGDPTLMPNEGEIHELLEEVQFQRILYEEVLDSQEIKEIMDYKGYTLEQAYEALDQGEVSAVVVIPEDFTLNTLVSLVSPFTQESEIRVIKNKDYTMTGRVVESIMEGFTQALSKAIIGKDTLLEMGAELGIGAEIQQRMHSFIQDTMGEEIHVTLREENIHAMDTINGMQYYSVAEAMMFILYVAAFGATYSLDERNHRTYERMVIGNVKPNQILLGRSITSFIIVLLQMMVFVLYSSLVFQISWGNLIHVALLSGAAALAVAGMTAFLSAFTIQTENIKLANIFDNVVIMIFAALGGSFVPLDFAPALKRIGSYMPTGAGVTGFIKIMQGYDFIDFLPQLILLSSMGIVLFALGMWTMGKGERI